MPELLSIDAEANRRCALALAFDGTLENNHRYAEAAVPGCGHPYDIPPVYLFRTEGDSRMHVTACGRCGMVTARDDGPVGPDAPEWVDALVAAVGLLLVLLVLWWVGEQDPAWQVPARAASLVVAGLSMGGDVRYFAGAGIDAVRCWWAER